MSERVPRTSPIAAPRSSEANPPAVSRPRTFSKRTNRGPTSRTTLASSKKRPDRSPLSPAFRPAAERSWQGNPPMTASTPLKSVPSNSWMSLNFGTVGQCLVSVRRQGSSISTCPTQRKLKTVSTAKSRPPIPLKRLKYVPLNQSGSFDKPEEPSGVCVWLPHGHLMFQTAEISYAPPLTGFRMCRTNRTLRSHPLLRGPKDTGRQPW